MIAQITVLVLGAGYTGSRVARQLAAQGVRVVETHRVSGSEGGEQGRSLAFSWPDQLSLNQMSGDLHVLHSIPLVSRDGQLYDPTPGILCALPQLPRRLVYLSTTGVYGRQLDVDERSAVAPEMPRETLRVVAERAVQAFCANSLILRPAAIYGPDRGAHVSMQRGEFKIAGNGSNYVSRIHVEDLAAITAAALLSEVTGSFPVADDLPATAFEIAEFCSELLGVPMAASVPVERLPETRRANRRVDGSAIRRLLGVELRYPTYREGIRAAVLDPPPASI